MTRSTTHIDQAAARRMALTAALLRGPRLPPNGDGIFEIARHFGGIQIDPTRTVEKTHYLVPWSRLGRYDRSEYERLLGERRLIEWRAFIVALDRLPEIMHVAHRWPAGDGSWVRRARQWVITNDEFRKSILDQLRDRGPLQSRQIDDSKVVADWESTGWTRAKNTPQMLEFMNARAEVFVSGRVGQERLWDLAERVIPADPPREELTEDEYEERRVVRAMRRFGVATLPEIRLRAYGLSIPKAKELLARLVEEGRLAAVEISYRGKPAPAFALPEMLDGASNAGRTRTTLLSPFDPLIYDRERTARLFGFEYKLEMYVPRSQRRFGHFSLPIVHGATLVGRLDSERDRKTGELAVNRVHWEDGEPKAAVRAAVDRQIARLADFIRG